MFDLDSNFYVMKEFCHTLQLWHRYIRDYIWITSNLFGSYLLNIESVVGSPGNPSTRPGWCLTCWSKPAGKQRTSAGVTPSPLPPVTPPPLPTWVHAAIQLVEKDPAPRCIWKSPAFVGVETDPTFLPFSGVFLWCGKGAWCHRSTWLPGVRSPTS